MGYFIRDPGDLPSPEDPVYVVDDDSSLPVNRCGFCVHFDPSRESCGARKYLDSWYLPEADRYTYRILRLPVVAGDPACDKYEQIEGEGEF